MATAWKFHKSYKSTKFAEILSGRAGPQWSFTWVIFFSPPVPEKQKSCRKSSWHTIIPDCAKDNEIVLKMHWDKCFMYA